ncbi:serine/threonine-protein kinase [Priestia megaterium]|uniref:serine/threonine-protein kinase n=1 Tax=Priestia megaterium TaxID=1404 RepID=UPI00159C6D8A|nr:serine/threonine-protein kinase [Priestia megaterium]
MSEKRVEPYRYIFKDEIGGGGYGKVFKGHEIFGEDNEVAIKVLKHEKLDDDSLERFNREIRIHSQLNHRHIVSILDFSLDDSVGEDEEGLAYYTMPLAKENLRTALQNYRENNFGYMDDATAVYYFNQILDGVEYAHREGIIHRDLKPENILVFLEEGEELLKISDFGLGKFLDGNTNLTHTVAALGSDVYAAPEQYGNSRFVNETADIFSLGKILYELLTYSLPVSIDLDKINDSKLKYVIRKATNTNPEKRYRSISEMKERIKMVMGNPNNLKNSTSQFNHLYEQWNTTFDNHTLKEICDLLIKQNSDFILYTQHFMNMDEFDFITMSNHFSEEFCEIVENYMLLIKGEHPFSFTDKICDFIFSRLLKCIESNETIYEKTLETVLDIGYTHNRFYIAREFAKEVSKVTDESLIMIIGEVLDNNPSAGSWVKPYFSDHSICMYLQEELEKL